ncbi:MAG: hypothetical protein ACJ74Q_26265 [Pyrinomonadaceae bacterium]
MKRDWRPIAGFTWEVLCIALAWSLAFATIPAMLLWVVGGAYPSSLLWLAFWCYFAITYKLTEWLSNKYRERQRRTLISARDLLKHDERPYVLYLRPFKDDETTSRLLNLSTEEQELATVIHEIGPFVAFGEPGEALPDPGAARMYIEHMGWQSKVEASMAGARLVVARVGNTAGFWWEMLTAVEVVEPERLLLLVPNDSDVYEEFREKAAKLFPHQLPKHQFRRPRFASFKSHISLEGLLYFEPDWTPRLRRLQAPFLRQNYWAPGVPTFKTALRPVYERFGIEWQRPPLQLPQILAVVMLLLFMTFSVYVIARLAAQLLALVRQYL